MYLRPNEYEIMGMVQRGKEGMLDERPACVGEEGHQATS